MTVKEICTELENWAPLAYQESYDNSRLIYGDPKRSVDKVLVALDITEEIVTEALNKEVDMIVSHHPLIFKGLKSLSPKSDAERALIKAIQNDIALYALHTNLDNVASGVNAEIGKRLGVERPRILSPKKGLLKKLVLFVPEKDWQSVAQAMWEAGAGSIGNYDQCSFRSSGTGSFRANEEADPQVGERGQLHQEDEYRLEVLVEQVNLNAVLRAMNESHPYEEVAYEIYPIDNQHQEVGSGMIGELPEPIDSKEFLKHIQAEFGGMLRYTAIPKSKVQRIAWCGGSGSFLLGEAKAQKADLFMSSDFKYHQFFEAENEILIADIGHYENEQFTIDLIVEHLQKKFPTFAVLLTENSTNPINYL